MAAPRNPVDGDANGSTEQRRQCNEERDCQPGRLQHSEIDTVGVDDDRPDHDPRCGRHRDPAEPHGAEQPRRHRSIGDGTDDADDGAERHQGVGAAEGEPADLEAVVAREAAHTVGEVSRSTNIADLLPTPTTRTPTVIPATIRTRSRSNTSSRTGPGTTSDLLGSPI